MERTWTQAQKSAIDERDRTLLVSAAAGSGKTAVLTERIIRTLTDTEHPADISRILVVTFTRAAAGELRQRISSALSAALARDSANKHLSRQLMLLGGASISTIDAFYLELVQAHFERAGLPASFRMADESELLSLRREIMNETVDAMFAEFPDFYRISDIFCDIRFEDSLTDTLLAISARLDRYPEGEEILLRSAREIQAGASDILHTAFGQVWAKEVMRLADTGNSLIDRTQACMSDQPTFAALQKIGAVLAELAERCRTVSLALANGAYNDAITALCTPLGASMGRGKVGELSPALADLLSLCEQFRDTFKKTAPTLGAFSEAEIKASAAETAALLTLVHEALTRFRAEYNRIKAVREIAEFSDVSRAAYRLLVDKNGTPTPLAAQIATRYDAVYIDEYQDVDAMQDATFRAISTERNRFMVGDIKQSIYRFRGAKPAVFADYRRRFPALADAGDSPEATVFMSDCFRCDKSVIRFTNAISGDLFSSCAESIHYTPEDDLKFSKTAETDTQHCRVVLIERDKENKDERENAEARFIAAEIKRLVSSERKADGTRIRYGDIAVLMRSTALCQPIAKCLSALGIPCNDTSRRSLFESPDVLCVYSLLAALDNPMRDVYLAAALRSPFFGFSLEDLVKIRAGADPALSLYESLLAASEQWGADAALTARILEWKERFHAFRQKATALPVDRLLRYLYANTAILSFTGRESDGASTPAARRENLQRLYEYARTFESGGFKGLYRFVRYVDGIMENEVKMPAPDGEENAVSLITIHHSKGLEYPVCFLAGTASRMSTEDTRPALLDDETLGCALRLSNAGPFSRANTFFREAISLSLARQNREEEMRVLYVAMTRARERLYVTANPSFGTKGPMERATLAATDCGAFLAEQATSYIDWILPALLRRDHSEYARIEILPEALIGASEQVADTARDEQAPTDTCSALLQKRFCFTYPYAHLTRLPAKLSVSKLSPGVLDVYDTDGVSPETVRKEDADRLLHTFERVPLFGSEDKERLAAARGTATHEFLQFCRFDKAQEHGVQEELSYLIEQRYLAPEVRELVRIDELERFFASGFYRSLKSARELRREMRFHIFLPAAEFTRDAAFSDLLVNEHLTVQGVIDLFFYDEDGRLVLCDYKTDRLTNAERADSALAAATLAKRHGEQLSYYARALTEICGRAPDRILVYSLHLGEAVEIRLP